MVSIIKEIFHPIMDYMTMCYISWCCYSNNWVNSSKVLKYISTSLHFCLSRTVWWWITTTQYMQRIRTCITNNFWTKKSHQLINNNNPQSFDHNSYTKSSELIHFVTTTHLNEKVHTLIYPHLSWYNYDMGRGLLVNIHRICRI